TLGKGEVGSSILPRGTILKSPQLPDYSSFLLQNRAKGNHRFSLQPRKFVQNRAGTCSFGRPNGVQFVRKSFPAHCLEKHLIRSQGDPARFPNEISTHRHEPFAEKDVMNQKLAFRASNRGDER
ncbi:MAG: hypothetical protein AAGF57_20255, partial [Pseudomonadota bacterium]